MATLNEIAYNIKNLAYNGDTNEEENVGIRQIKFWIHYHRAKILKKLATEGKGVPQECLQKITFEAENYRQYNYDSVFFTWASSQNGWDNNALVAYSKRTASLSTTSTASSINTAEFYGNDYYPEERGGQRDEMGILNLVLPQILNIDGYGVKNLKLSKRKGNSVHNLNHIDVPVTDKTISVRHGYSRFGKKSITSYIENDSAFVGGGLEQVLVITNLQSVFRQSNQQDDIAIPVFYGVSANLLLSNPTKFQDWANDDEVYPFPDYLIADLTREVMQEMQIALSTQPDMVTDGYDTTRTQVQQRAQR